MTGILKVWNAEKSKCVFRSTETNTNDRFLFAEYVEAQDAILAVTEDCNIYFYGRKDMTFCKEVKQVRLIKVCSFLPFCSFLSCLVLFSAIFSFFMSSHTR